MVESSAIEKFIEAVNASPALKQECQKALDGSSDPSGFVALGKKNGYTFSEREARAYFNEIFNAPSSEALSGRRLDAVLGAKDSHDAGPRDQRLKQAVIMFKTMSFKKTPEWTDFGF